ncbi:MAG TPA: Fur family transcriptional regulator [Acidimicrobiia bacterium]|nr:Fur family transcriptional regulator [Acidimicrobiia bacterium]
MSLNAAVGPRVTDRLTSAGTRFTPSRRRVVDALLAAPGPVTPAELDRMLDGAVPLSSLYRAIAMLEEAGVVTRTHDPAGVILIELSEWLAGHHHHLVCRSCGEVIDVEIPHDTEMGIRTFIDQIAAEAGYAVTGHRIDIEGTCRSCRRA